MSTPLPVTTFRKWIFRLSSRGSRPVARTMDVREAASFALGKGESLTCLQGLLWVTSDRDGQDHLLSSGERFTSGRPTRVVVEALEKSVVKQ